MFVCVSEYVCVCMRERDGTMWFQAGKMSECGHVCVCEKSSLVSGYIFRCLIMWAFGVFAKV